MVDREKSFAELVEELTRIKDEKDGRSACDFIVRKCDVYIAFADQQMQFFDESNPDELGTEICNLRAGALNLRAECGRLMRDRSLKPNDLTTVRADDNNLSVLMGNICLLLNPGLLSAVDAVA